MDKITDLVAPFYQITTFLLTNITFIWIRYLTVLLLFPEI